MSMTTETPAKAKRERPKMDPDVKVALIGLFLIIAGAIAVIIAFRHQMASVDMEAPFILWTLLTVLGGFAAIGVGASMVTAWDMVGLIFVVMATGVLIALPGGMAIMSNTVEQNHVAFLEEQGYERVEHVRDPDFTSSLPESKTVYYEGTLDGTLYEIHFAPDDEKGTTEYDAFKKETDTPDKTHRSVEP